MTNDYPDAFKFGLPVQIRFNDLDPLGHVTNAVYHVYYNLVSEEYFEQVVKRPQEDSKVNFVVATVTVDFLKPIFYHSKILAQMRIPSLGRKSFRFEARLVDAQDGSLYSFCSGVNVCYSVVQQTSIPLPEAWREKIADFEKISL